MRDKLVNGELDMAHVLYGLIYAVQLGTAGPKKDMAVLMTINNNGQAITLSKALADKGAVDGPSLAKTMAKEKREYTFAGTFPTGTHAMWINYWLAASGISPITGAKLISVPPPQMVANMRVGSMDGFCVGEPWNARAIIDGVGVTAITTQDIWKDHPEKVLGTQLDFVKKYPNTLPRRDDGRARGEPLDRHRPAEQDEDGRHHRREELRQHDARRDQPAHPRPLHQRHGPDLGRPQTT